MYDHPVQHMGCTGSVKDFTMGPRAHDTFRCEGGIMKEISQM